MIACDLSDVINMLVKRNIVIYLTQKKPEAHRKKKLYHNGMIEKDVESKLISRDLRQWKLCTAAVV